MDTAEKIAYLTDRLELLIEAQALSLRKVEIYAKQAEEERAEMAQVLEQIKVLKGID